MARSSGAAARALTSVPASNGRGRPEALVESYRRLAEVFHHVLSEHEPEALLDRIADTLAELMPYNALHIYEADEELNQLVPVLARGGYHDEIMQSRPRFGEGLTGWAAQNRSPVWTNQAHLDPRTENVPGTPVEPEAMIVVPLIARGALKGALNVYRIGEDAEFLDHEFELAKWFGDAAALALDNAQMRAHLEHQAQTDSLTGLYNHRYFHERLRSELTRASRSHDSVAVLMFDIDDFKKVNDIYGHGAGDQLLIQLAHLARDTVRGSDVVCRLGGEEFGVIMTSCDAGDALGLAARLTERLRAAEFEPAGGITVSIGVSQGPQHAMNPRELVACAEAAMMTAKARGKNKVVLFDESATERPLHGTTPRDVRSIAHLKMLQSLAGKLNRLNAVREIGDTIATELRLLIDYHNCRVFLREGDDLAPIAFVGDLETTVGGATEALKTRVGEGITGRCVADGESLLIPNALECDFAHRIPGTTELEESLAAVPLRYGTRVIGAIVISKLGVDQFDDDDVRLLEVLAGQASVALENARLYEAQRRETENAKALLRFAELVSRAPSFRSVCRDTVAAAAELFEAGRVSLWLQEADDRFACNASYGFAGDVDAETVTHVRIPAETVAEWLGERDEPFLCSEDESHAVLPPAAWRRALIAPLVAGDGVTGWIAVRTSDELLREETRRLLAGLVYHASTALQKARSYERQRESAEIANALLDASRELATADGPDELLGRIVEVTARVLGTTRAALWIQDDRAPHELVARASVGYADRHESADWTRFPAEVAHEWLDERTEPFVLEPRDAAMIDGTAEFDDVSRFAIAPLRVDAGRVGALTTFIGERGFDARDLRLLAGLAHQAKLALEGAAHLESLERTFVTTVEALANALEAKDEYTSSHARWITDMALEVGNELDLDRDALKRLELGALFHDIGKIGIPSEILQKPGPLTDEEFEIVKEHPELGERILEPIERLSDVRPIVRACHERWDGLGYPDGKAGDEIPIEARIVLVCDAFHAMTTDRPYRGRLDAEVAVSRLRESSGTQFDPVVVGAFLRLFESGRVLPLE
jgi:diguanylate cyclase (GGDEF)-like protein